jgi:hypothetical protein
MGSRALVVSSDHNPTAPGNLILGHGGMAHGLECKRGGDGRSHPAALGKDFLERGIKNNPDRPQLYEALARVYKEKYKDHEHASEFFAKAAVLPGAPSFDRRFSAYELSYCEGREREAYDRLRQLYNEGKKEQLPTLITRLKFLENKLGIPQDERIPDRAP